MFEGLNEKPATGLEEWADGKGDGRGHKSWDRLGSWLRTGSPQRAISHVSINILIKNIKSFGPQLNKMYLWIQKVISSLVHNQVLHISWSIAIKHLRILAGLAEALELRRRKIFHKLQIFFNVHFALQTNRQDVKFVSLKIFHNIGFAANW